MAQGNKGFAGLVIGGGEGLPEARRPPRSGILGSRESRLAEIATGAAVTRVHESVDPALCRIWDGHNRDYGALTEASCSDLIDSLRSQGRQEVPAIVRRVQDGSNFRFEIICGARRHWSVSWLRAHDYPDFRFVVEPRELTDEEAFRVADLENRSRQDLSDYERAVDYAKAIERYYGGSQQRMVERLNISKGWLSRYLELAKLPPEILSCFESPHVIRVTHAAKLAPALSNPVERRRVLEMATAVKAERKDPAQPWPQPASIVSRLLAIKKKPSSRGAKPFEVRDDTGLVLARMIQQPKGTVSITVPAARAQSRAALRAALEKCLDELSRDR